MSVRLRIKVLRFRHLSIVYSSYPVCHLHAGHVFGMSDQSHHVVASQNQGLAVPPALHGVLHFRHLGNSPVALPLHAFPHSPRRTNSPIPSLPSHWAPSTITCPRRNTFFTRPVTRCPSKSV